MSIQDLGALGELIGSVAVLATLVYLTLQTRQNTMAISAQVDAARINSSLNVNLSMASSEEILKTMADDTADPSAAINAVRLGAIFRSIFYNFQWQFVQGRRGLLPTYREASIADGVRTYFRAYRSFESWWTAEGVLLVPEFVEWVEEQRAKAA